MNNINKIRDSVRKKVDEYEIYSKNSLTNRIQFESNKLFSITTNSSGGYAVRIIRNKRAGLSSSSNYEKINETVKNAVESSNFGDRIKFHFPVFKKNEYKEVRTYDPLIKKIKISEYIDTGNNIINKLVEEFGNIKVFLDFNFSDSFYSLVNSSGLSMKQKYSMVSFSINTIIITDDGLLDCYDYISSRKTGMDITRVISKLRHNIRAGLKTVRIKPKKYKVLFTQKAVPLLFKTFIQGINGKTLQKGISPLSNKTGKQVIDKRISFIDNPLREMGTGSYSFDDEGYPSSKKYIFKKGIFKKFIFDLNSSSLLNTSSTGNAERSLSSHPYPAISNFECIGGDIKLENIIKNMGEGIIVDQVIGGGQSNMLAGDFSVNIDIGFYIKNGKIQGRIKNSMIAGNVYNIFNRILAISSDRINYGSVLTPAILFDGLNVEC